MSTTNDESKCNSTKIINTNAAFAAATDTATKQSPFDLFLRHLNNKLNNSKLMTKRKHHQHRTTDFLSSTPMTHNESLIGDRKLMKSKKIFKVNNNNNKCSMMLESTLKKEVELVRQQQQQQQQQQRIKRKSIRLDRLLFSSSSSTSSSQSPTPSPFRWPRTSSLNGSMIDKLNNNKKRTTAAIKSIQQQRHHRISRTKHHQHQQPEQKQQQQQHHVLYEHHQSSFACNAALNNENFNNLGDFVVWYV